MSAEKEPSVPRRRLSCSQYFDALWFCYSPVHQLQQYYRVGVLDNCYGKWNALWDCLYLKTKPSSELQGLRKQHSILSVNAKYGDIHVNLMMAREAVEEILEAREKAKSHIWTFRTPEEAQSYWEKEFGHLDDMDR